MAAITAANLGNNLVFALDAGDGASYGGGTSWLDTSGNDHHFFLGATNGVDSTDPTFNGLPGALSSAEYFSSDGGDLFTYNTSNPAAIDALHKDNAAFTLLATIWDPPGSTFSLLGTASLISNVGIDIRIRGTDKVTIEGVNGSGSTQLLSKTSDAAISTNAWTVVALSINEAGGSSGSFLWEKGSYLQVGSSNTFDAVYTSPSASGATHTAQIGARGNSASPLPNTGRIAQIALWSTSISKVNLDALYGQAGIKTRFGL
jgi:hypothetical protein